MPHLIIECSENIATKIDFEPVFANCHQFLSECLPADVQSCKSRVVPCGEYLVGSGACQNFLHVTLKVLSGRSDEVLAKTGQLLFDRMRTLLDEHSFVDASLSVEVDELSAFYFK